MKNEQPEIQTDAFGEYLLCPECGERVREGEDEYDGDTLMPTGVWTCSRCGWSYNVLTDEEEPEGP